MRLISMKTRRKICRETDVIIIQQYNTEVWSRSRLISKVSLSERLAIYDPTLGAIYKKCMHEIIIYVDYFQPERLGFKNIIDKL